jgi:hypothetical protein
MALQVSVAFIINILTILYVSWRTEMARQTFMWFRAETRKKLKSMNYIYIGIASRRFHLICQWVKSSYCSHWIYFLFNRCPNIQSWELDLLCTVILRSWAKNCLSVLTVEEIMYIEEICGAMWNLNVAKNLHSSVHIVPKEQNRKAIWRATL